MLALWTVVAAIVVYGYPITNFAVHIDAEVTIRYTSWWSQIALDRWGTGLVREFLIRDPPIPYLTPLVSAVLFAAAGIVAASCLTLDAGAKFAFCLLYVAFPQFAYQVEFPIQSDCVALGVLMTTASFWLFLRTGEGRRPRRLAAIGSAFVLQVVGLSFYQSIVFVPFSICLLWCVRQRLFGLGSLRAALTTAVGFGLTLAASGLACFVLAGVVRHAHGIGDAAARLGEQIGWGGAAWRVVLPQALAALRVDATGGLFYGNALYLTAWLPVAVIAVRLVASRRVATLLLLLAAAVAPYSIVLVLGQQQAPRTFVAASVMFAGLWITALDATGIRSRVVWGGLAAVSLLFGAIHVSRLFYADSVALDADKLLGNRIVATLYRKYPTFDERVTPVAFVGAYAPPNRWRGPGYDVFGASFFWWGGGSSQRIDSFLETAGIASFIVPQPPAEAAARAAAQALPVWPNPDCMAMTDGVAIIRLGR